MILWNGIIKINMLHIIQLLKDKYSLGQKIFAKNYPDEYKQILNYTSKFNITDWSEIKYVYINQLQSIPKCKICDNNARFYKSLNRYMHTCCKECDKKLKSLSHLAYWNNLSQDEKIIRLNHEQLVKKDKYGYSTPFQCNDIKNKILQSNIAKYGVSNVFKLKNIQNKANEYRSSHRKEINSKIKNSWSKLDKQIINDKRKSTLIDIYGVDNYSKTSDFKKLYNNENFVNNITSKNYQSKKKNNTFNKSFQEDKIFELLSAKFNVIRQYKDIRYTYSCDFYIPDLDLFIEYNGTWTHGSKPYVDNLECNAILDKWKEKSKNSKFYKNAIYTWSVLDVKKRNIAKQNKLNYLEFFNMNQFNEWYKTK